ncbi:MAG: hypothetical protein IJE08_08565 [Clostridia bacterium]|nr:hypothetical protein [Clostridia bacterium]
MNQNAMTRMLIENLADRYISKIQFDPHRSIRKLVDLGECLSKGDVQKQFFQAVQKLLEKENNPYYALVQRVISQFDAAAIKTIGMNLSLNSWSALAGRKSREAAPPWTLMFEMKSAPNALNLDELTALLRKSAETGIHTFLFWLDRSYDKLDALTARLKEFSDCAVALFTPADMIDKSALGQVRQARNLLLSVEDTASIDTENAADALRSLRCPFALHTVYNTPTDAENILCGRWLDRVSRLFSPFAFFFPGAECSEENHMAVREYARRLRTAPQHPVFSMSLCDDVADVDELITGKPRLLRIGPDGTIDAGSRLLRISSGVQPANKIALSDMLQQYTSPLPTI